MYLNASYLSFLQFHYLKKRSCKSCFLKGSGSLFTNYLQIAISLLNSITTTCTYGVLFQDRFLEEHFTFLPIRENNEISCNVVKSLVLMQIQRKMTIKWKAIDSLQSKTHFIKCYTFWVCFFFGKNFHVFASSKIHIFPGLLDHNSSNVIIIQTLD